MAGTSNNTDWEAILLTERESPIPAGEGLIVGLLSSTWVSPSMPAVDDRIIVVCIVFVATGEDY